MAKLLPRAAHLKQVVFYGPEVAELLAEDTTFNWFQNAHELRRITIWGIDNMMDRYMQHLPLRLEDADFSLSSTLTTYGLACLKLPTNLKSLSLSSGNKNWLSEEGLRGLASLTNLESLSIRGATLYALPTWLPKRMPALQELSLGYLITASHRSTLETRDCQLQVKALAHLKLIESLRCLGTVPHDIGTLRNMKRLHLDTDAREIDLGVLRPCGSKLQTVDITIKPSWTVGQAKPTFIRGLENLSGLREFYCRGPSDVYPCDVTVDLQVGVSTIECFYTSCEGRFFFTGRKEAFTHFCRKLRYLWITILQPQDVSDREIDAAFDPLLLAAEQKGLKAEIQSVDSPKVDGCKRRDITIETIKG